MEDNYSLCGGGSVEEMREGAAGFRQVQELVRDSRFVDAAALLEELLAEPNLGRTRRAQLHALACWLYDGPLQQSGPLAVLHGEEAVRLAELLQDPWHRAEAQSHLTGARIHMGDAAGARRELDRLVVDLVQNPALLAEGERTRFLLTLLLAACNGEWAESLALLIDLTPQPDLPEVELIRAWASLKAGAPPAAVRQMAAGETQDPILEAERALLLAHVTAADGRRPDGRAVRTAYLRLAAAGRRDLLGRLGLPETPVDDDRGDHGGDRQEPEPDGA
jgi:hypothetical protein